MLVKKQVRLSMRILFAVNGFGDASLGGACVYHNNLAKALRHRGHEVRVCSRTALHAGMFEGIEVNPMGHRDALAKHADVVITTPIMCGAIRHKNKIIILHSDQPIPTLEESVKVIYVAEHLRQKHMVPNRSMVFWPMMWLSNEHWRADDDVHGLVFGAINVKPSKGSAALFDLAQRMPDNLFRFIVHDSDMWRVPKLPNIDIWPMLMYDAYWMNKFYSKVDVMLLPSHTEGFCTVAMECAYKGIPVIATPIPGIKEVLGSAGIYCEPQGLYDAAISINTIAAARAMKMRGREIEAARNWEELQAFILTS